jgi:hypothetical protein
LSVTPSVPSDSTDPPDLNAIFNVSVFNIPKTISKYLTYTLIIHIIALGFAVFANQGEQGE